ncbi:MAG: tyrosine-type recombinase/integrase [Dehalococcoidales bacterium]|nr:tyrosine-type recombinase/integrase [Dehalococcoidales bacterium]
MGGSVLRDAKTGHWFIQLRWLGKTERFYRYEYKGDWLSFESKAHAKKVLSLMQREVDNGSFSPASYRPNSPLAVKQYVETWLPLTDVVKETRRKYKGFSKHFISFLGENKDIREISKINILQLKKHIEERGYSEKTVYHIINTLKTMLRFALDNKDLKELPSFPKLKDPIKKTIEFLSAEDQRKVFEAIPERHRPIFELAAEYGLRPQEARALMKDAVTDTHIIIMRRFSEYQLLDHDKTDNIRMLRLTDKAREILKSAAPSFSKFIFTHNGKTTYDEHMLTRIWNEACNQVGVNIRLYNGVRHSRAGQLLDAGYPMELVSELLGHSKIQTTRDRYGRVSEKRINDALEQVRVFQFTDNVPTISKAPSN